MNFEFMTKKGHLIWGLKMLENTNLNLLCSIFMIEGYQLRP